ncbi:MAG: RnfABCDGE type electron transport complex subunit B [Eubacteriales bacterium]
MDPILLAILIVTTVGIIGAIVLVTASIVMYVPVDERIEKISEILPGANCGGCGCAGCADYAKTIVEDGNALTKCAPGGGDLVGKLAEIMGSEAGAVVPLKASISCAGTCEKTEKRFEFQGELSSCLAVKSLYGGDGKCSYGCLGYGDCVVSCGFDALKIVDGIAVVDRDKCVGCGACATACPNHIIDIIPEHKRKPIVACQNEEKGGVTGKQCKAGCIGCTKCVKACPKDAIVMKNSVAVIDQEKCVGCQLCIKECPKQIILVPAQR